MNCLECQELLQLRLDGAVDSRSQGELGNEALEQHLNQCTTCREQYAAAARLLEGLKELPRPKVSANFVSTLTADLIRDRRKRRDKVRRGVFLTMALAASVMLLLVAAYYWIPPRGANKQNEIVHVPKKETPPLPPEKKPDRPPEPSPLTPVIDRLADRTRDHAKVVQVAMNLDAMENLPAMNNLPPMEVREASQEVSDSVRTVTRNARKAFDFFVRELPLPDMGELKN